MIACHRADVKTAPDPFVDREKETALLETLLRKHSARGALVVVVGQVREEVPEHVSKWLAVALRRWATDSGAQLARAAADDAGEHALLAQRARGG